MDNIKESKEYQLAKDWERAVNDYGFNPKRFAAAIPEMHPTLQQSLYRLVKECIVVMADETRNYDDRNRASHEEAKCIMDDAKTLKLPDDELITELKEDNPEWFN